MDDLTPDDLEFIEKVTLTPKPEKKDALPAVVKPKRASPAPAPKGDMGRSREKADKTIRRISDYEKSDAPFAEDDSGKPSLAAELADYVSHGEGRRFMRKAIRAQVVQAAYGDREAFKLIFDTEPNITKHLHKILSSAPPPTREQIRAQARGETPILDAVTSE